jgi:hypothetical protein
MLPSRRKFQDAGLSNIRNLEVLLLVYLDAVTGLLIPQDSQSAGHLARRLKKQRSFGGRLLAREA